jgi:hypothetical protein
MERASVAGKSEIGPMPEPRNRRINSEEFSGTAISPVLTDSPLAITA